MLARFTHIVNKRHLIPPEQVEFRHGWCLEDSSVYGGRGLRKVDVTRWMASTGAQQMPSSPRPRSPRQSPTLVIRTCRYYDTSEGSCVSAALRRSGGSVCRWRHLPLGRRVPMPCREAHGEHSVVENRTLSVKSYLHIDVGSKSSRRSAEEQYIQGAPNVLSIFNYFLFVSR